MKAVRLSGANLILSDFRGSLFHNAVNETQLMEALDGANFMFADLKNANLQGAYLTHAQLEVQSEGSQS